MLPTLPFVAIMIVAPVSIALLGMLCLVLSAVFHSRKADAIEAEVNHYLAEIGTLRKAWNALGTIIEREASEIEYKIFETTQRVQSIQRDRQIKRAIAATLARHIDRVVDPTETPDFAGFSANRNSVRPGFVPAIVMDEVKASKPRKVARIKLAGYGQREQASQAAK